MKKARQKQARRELTRCFFHKNHMLFIAALAVGIAINCSNLLFSYLIQRITDVAMGHDIAPLWRLLMITAVGIAAFFALEWLWSVVYPVDAEKHCILPAGRQCRIHFSLDQRYRHD